MDKECFRAFLCSYENAWWIRAKAGPMITALHKNAKTGPISAALRKKSKTEPIRAAPGFGRISQAGSSEEPACETLSGGLI